MKILITGAGGQIGADLITAFVAGGHQVIATASRQPQNSIWCMAQRSRERSRMKVCPARWLPARPTRRTTLLATPRSRNSAKPRCQKTRVGGRWSQVA